MGVAPRQYETELEAYVSLITAILEGFPSATLKQEWVAWRLPRTFALLQFNARWGEMFREAG